MNEPCLAPATTKALIATMESLSDNTAWAMERAFAGYEAQVEHWRERALAAERVVARLERMRDALDSYDFDQEGQHR